MQPKHVAVRARRDDPETSQQAAFAFEANQTNAQRSVQVVVAILKAAAHPLTDFEIAERWRDAWGSDKFSESLPRKARHWARQQGLVCHSGFAQHGKRRVRTWSVGADVIFHSRAPVRCTHCGELLDSEK